MKPIPTTTAKNLPIFFAAAPELFKYVSHCKANEYHHGKKKKEFSPVPYNRSEGELSSIGSNLIQHLIHWITLIFGSHCVRICLLF